MSPHVRGGGSSMSGEDPTAKMAPGDKAPKGTPGAGTGVVIEEVGGA